MSYLTQSLKTFNYNEGWFYITLIYMKLTFLWSASNASHMDATIFDTSPNDAFGF